MDKYNKKLTFVIYIRIFKPIDINYQFALREVLSEIIQQDNEHI
jgi:hypothetical protein